MTGTSKSGRKRKPVAVHLAQGTFQNVRHGQALELTGKPIKPKTLKAKGSKVWDLVIKELPADLISGLDAVSLEELCRLIDVRESLQNKLRRTPTDEKLIRLILVTGEKMIKLSTEFGMTPSARAGMTRPTKQAKADPLTKYLKAE